MNCRRCHVGSVQEQEFAAFYDGEIEKPKNAFGRFEDQGHHPMCSHSQS